MPSPNQRKKKPAEAGLSIQRRNAGFLSRSGAAAKAEAGQAETQQCERARFRHRCLEACVTDVVERLVKVNFLSRSEIAPA